MIEKQGTLILRVDANVPVKNEALLLEQILPEWDSYPIDHFVFFDDRSYDGTSDVIQSILEKDRYTIFRDPHQNNFDESKTRSTMLEHSRDNGADIVISIDADELLSDPFIDQWDGIMSQSLDHKLMTFQWNVVGDLRHYRCDPAYYSNYRDFIFPMNHTDSYDLGPCAPSGVARTPNINAPVGTLHDESAFVHLQALNVRFYALKQLWYKTFEYLHYDKSVDQINAAYDPVVNGLDFCSRDMPSHILSLDTFDSGVFDCIAKERGYVDYILEYSVPELITFGGEYLK